MQHSFDIEVAQKYGVEVAIFLKNLSFWIAHNKANEKNFHKERYWTYNSIKAFSQLFPYWSEPQIKRLITKMIDLDLIIKDKFNDNPYDHTPWYTLTDLGEKVSPLPLGRNRTDDKPKSYRRQTEIVPSSYTDLKPDRKPNKKAFYEKNVDNSKKHDFAESMNKNASEKKHVQEHEKRKKEECKGKRFSDDTDQRSKNRTEARRISDSLRGSLPIDPSRSFNLKQQ